MQQAYDLDDLTLDADGGFRVILSAERPAGHTGDWWELREQTVRLLMRRCSCDWTHGGTRRRFESLRLDSSTFSTASTICCSCCAW